MGRASHRLAEGCDPRRVYDAGIRLNKARMQERWQVKLVTKRAQSPDLNVIDLSFLTSHLQVELERGAEARLTTL